MLQIHVEESRRKPSPVRMDRVQRLHRYEPVLQGSTVGLFFFLINIIVVVIVFSFFNGGL